MKDAPTIWTNNLFCFLEDPLDPAREAKTEYNADDDHPGMNRLKAAISDEAKFAKILDWIQESGICLRRGTEAKNACYAMNDNGFDTMKPMDMAFWLTKPYTKKVDNTDKW